MCWISKKNKRRAYPRVDGPPRMILGRFDSEGSRQVLLSSCRRKGCDCGYTKPKRSCKRSCKEFLLFLNPWCLLTSLVLSLLLLGLSFQCAEWGAKQVIYSLITLKEGSAFEATWKKGEPALTYKAYIFNLTNPEEFKRGARPRVVEQGPYVYQLKEQKENIVYNSDNTVTFQGRPIYTFQRSKSVGPENDLVTTFNVPLINAGEKVRGSPIGLGVLNAAKRVHDFKSLKEVSVGKLLWGHRSKVLDWARQFTKVPYPYQDFGLMMGRNDTLQPSYTMHTGAGGSGSIYNIRSVLKYNNSDHLQVWSGDFCNKIKGTDMGGFHPEISRKEVLHVFNGQLCRSLPLIYNKTVYHSGLEAYRFINPPGTFAYGPHRSKNRCYCSKEGCPQRGILDMKSCYFGAAVAFSFPHFYQGHPSLTHKVQGLR